MERLSELQPVFIDTLPENAAIDPGKIYISRKHAVAKLLCPDGCGTVSVLDFSREGWKLTESNGKIMIHPSILETNCPNRAHYYVTFNRIQWL
ncbi:MAG: hypothetical protein IKN60_04870 [Bacteroidales bacterium]|nr:hypothetical protein [Bacteroidales bacterium]